MPRTSSSLFHNLFFRHVAGRRTSSGTYLPFSSTHPNVFSRRFSTSELVSRSRNSIPSPAPVTLTVDGKAVKFTGDIESSAGHVGVVPPGSPYEGAHVRVRLVPLEATSSGSVTPASPPVASIFPSRSQSKPKSTPARRSRLQAGQDKYPPFAKPSIPSFSSPATLAKPPSPHSVASKAPPLKATASPPPPSSIISQLPPNPFGTRTGLRPATSSTSPTPSPSSAPPSPPATTTTDGLHPSFTYASESSIAGQPSKPTLTSSASPIDPPTPVHPPSLMDLLFSRPSSRFDDLTLATPPTPPSSGGGKSPSSDLSPGYIFRFNLEKELRLAQVARYETLMEEYMKLAGIGWKKCKLGNMWILLAEGEVYECSREEVRKNGVRSASIKWLEGQIKKMKRKQERARKVTWDPLVMRNVETVVDTSRFAWYA